MHWEIIFSPFRLILNALKVAGGPVPMVEGVFRAGGAPQYAVSDSGTLVYMPGTSASAAAASDALSYGWTGMGRRSRLQPHPMLTLIPEYLPMEREWLCHSLQAGIQTSGSGIWFAKP